MADFWLQGQKSVTLCASKPQLTFNYLKSMAICACDGGEIKLQGSVSHKPIHRKLM